MKNTKKILLDVFIDELYESLHINKLGLKAVKYSNQINYSICPIENTISFDKELLKENLSNYYFDFTRINEQILNEIFSNLINKFPKLLFSQLSSLSPFQSHRKGIDGIFNTLVLSLKNEDLITYLKSYNDKQFICNNYYAFSKLLDEIHKKFKDDSEFISILLHNFHLHSKLIKKTKGNIIATRSWCIKNLNNIEKFEHFFANDSKEPLFVNLKFNNHLLFLNVETIQTNFVLNNAQGIKRYEDFLKSLLVIINSEKIKKELNIHSAFGQFVFDKSIYQITFFNEKIINCDIIEKYVPFLLQVICDYFNRESQITDDFENQVFKGFQYYLLNEKLIPLGKISNVKIGKI